MAGTLGGETRSFLTCERCQPVMLETVAAWVGADSDRRWVTMGAARRWHHGRAS